MEPQDKDAPLPARTGPFPDWDPRIDAVATTLWEQRTFGNTPTWAEMAAGDPETAALVRRDAADVLAAAGVPPQVDPRLDVVAESLYSWERQPFSAPWEKVHPEFRETFRFRAVHILTALDEAARV